MKDYSTHLAGHLRGAGMETVLCGVQHVAPDKRMLPYDRVLDGSVDYFTDPALDPGEYDKGNARLVREYLSQRHDRPFFLSFGLLTSHRPLRATADKAPWELRAPPPLVPDLPDTRADAEAFYSAVERADGIIGEVMAALDEYGLRDDTAVVVTTDHGPPFPEMKGTLYDGGVGVSLIMRVPGVTDAVPGGRVADALVTQLDVAPTVLELLCESPTVSPDVPEGGTSLLPLLAGHQDRVHDAIFAESNYHAVYEPARAVRTERYKLIRRFGHGGPPVPPVAANVDDSAAKALLAEAGYFERGQATDVLIDLFLDPMERCNVIDEPAYREAAAALRQRLEEWMAATDDPLLHGEVPRPAESRVNRPDAWSATEETIE